MAQINRLPLANLQGHTVDACQQKEKWARDGEKAQLARPLARHVPEAIVPFSEGQSLVDTGPFPPFREDCIECT